MPHGVKLICCGNVNPMPNGCSRSVCVVGSLAFVGTASAHGVGGCCGGCGIYSCNVAAAAISAACVPGVVMKVRVLVVVALLAGGNVMIMVPSGYQLIRCWWWLSWYLNCRVIVCVVVCNCARTQILLHESLGVCDGCTSHPSSAEH